MNESLILINHLKMNFLSGFVASTPVILYCKIHVRHTKDNLIILSKKLSLSLSRSIKTFSGASQQSAAWGHDLKTLKATRETPPHSIRWLCAASSA